MFCLALNIYGYSPVVAFYHATCVCPVATDQLLIGADQAYVPTPLPPASLTISTKVSYILRGDILRNIWHRNYAYIRSRRRS